ncbi:MAG: hypothetical protein LLG04_12300 [Parachlamydia sp.]|nr:hypothetical protein [Parachlamydia sp.]
MQVKPYSFCEKILRTCVLQMGVYKGRLERLLTRIYEIFNQRTCYPQLFDPRQAERALAALKNLGAEVQFVTPKDGRARLQMLVMRPEALENRLQQVGARWEKVAHRLAILPPSINTPQWRALEKDLLTLKWKKETISLSDGSRREMIVTCEHADRVPESEHNRNLFLHNNSAGVSFIMLKRRIGFILGCRQTICLFDPRGTWKSSGIASEGGYYNDIEAVYDKARAGFDPRKIWISGSCGGMSAAAHLKAKLHGTGVNLALENGSVNVKRDWVDPKSCLIRRFATRYWSGLSSRDIPASLKPKETGFNIEELWKNLGMSDIGKVMLVSVSNDQRLSSHVAKHNHQLAQKVSRHVQQLFFKSPSKGDPHTDFYFKYPKAAAQALDFFFT